MRKRVFLFGLPFLLCLVFGGIASATQATLMPNPRWRVQVIIYRSVAAHWHDGVGSHSVVTQMDNAELQRAITATERFFAVDVPALNSGQMTPLPVIDVKDQLVLSSPYSCGWWPDPGAVAKSLRPDLYDSAVVIWKDDGWDSDQRRSVSLACYGGLTWPRGTGQTFTSFILKMIPGDQRNVFKHEWGHSILFYYDSAGTAPRPAVNNHINATNTQYVNCKTRLPYVLLDETDGAPIPNSIYHNESGFTHDYYSGLTATPDQPDRCLGIPPATWATGGPLTKPIQNPGDLNSDGKVDLGDLSRLMTVLGQTAQPNDPRDLDYDGRLTVLDARRLVTLCTKPNCAP